MEISVKNRDSSKVLVTPLLVLQAEVVTVGRNIKIVLFLLFTSHNQALKLPILFASFENEE